MFGKKAIFLKLGANQVFRNPACIVAFQSLLSTDREPRRIWSWVKWALAIIALLFIVHFAYSADVPQTSNTNNQTNSNPNYALDYKDTIGLVVLRHEEYSGAFIVPQNGSIVFPGIGELLVKGKTLAELQSLITEKLSIRLRRPEVYVTLNGLQPRYIYVIGQVGLPGSYQIEPNWRVSEALAVAGGLKMKPERMKAFLFRAGHPEQPLDLSGILQNGDPKANVLLKPGDTISIQETRTMHIYLAGLLTMPGEYDLEIGTGAIEAVAKAGGYTEHAALSKAIIYRGGQAIPVDLFKGMVKGDHTANVTLESADVLVVPPNNRRFAVLGEVITPGWFNLIEGRETALSDALSMAGNVSKRGITTHLYILRTIDGKVQRISVNFQSFIKKADITGNPSIQDGDVVYVPETKRIAFESILSGLASINILGGVLK